MTEIRALWAAVLSQAVDDIRRDLQRTSSLQARGVLRHWQRDAVAWFTSGAKGRGSFIWVCELLRMDPAAIRRQVMNE